MKKKELSKMKNVVLLTLDCVRPDHVGCFGYKGVKTPAIDGLAKAGIIFEQAFCQAPNTWVSLASVFTGCNPTKHGLHTPYDKINDVTPTIAEILSNNGYSTVGFPAHNLVGRRANFHRGFDVFYEDNYKFNSKIEGLKWGTNWKKVLNLADTEIKSKKNKPLFLWFHYMNTHHFPHNSIPLPYLYRFRYSSKWQYYDGKISYADKICINSIVNILKKNSIFENTIIIIFSDHGEELEKGSPPKHDNLLYDDVLRILLLISAPSFLPVNKRIKDIVRSIDIVPTILDLIKINAEEISFDGQSLAKLFKENDLNENWAYSENIPKKLLSIRTKDSRLVVKIEIEDTNNKTKIRASEFLLYDIRNDDSRNEWTLRVKQKIPTDLLKVINIVLSDLKQSIDTNKSNQDSYEIEKLTERLKSLGYI